LLVKEAELLMLLGFAVGGHMTLKPLLWRVFYWCCISHASIGIVFCIIDLQKTCPTRTLLAVL